MFKNHPYLFCSWYPTGYFVCATGWPVLEAGVLDRQGLRGKFRGCLHLTALQSFANLSLETAVPVLKALLTTLKMSFPLYYNIYQYWFFILEFIKFKSFYWQAVTLRSFLFQPLVFFWVSKLIVFRVVPESYFLVISKPVATARFHSITK